MKSFIKNASHPIGAIFTPPEWAMWLVEKYGIVDKWLSGKSVLDPTCGHGAFIFAIIDSAHKEKIPISKMPIENLFGIEKEKKFISIFQKEFSKKYEIDFPKRNIICADVLLDSPEIRADILVGNPPWLNFSDLPIQYKERIKNKFVEYGLTDNTKSLLLGCSRVDISALIVAKTIYGNLNKNGEAAFFLPLSLFLNPGAHEPFRNFRVKDVSYSLNELHDFNETEIFANVLTRYGAAYFKRDETQKYPIKCHILQNKIWSEHIASPINNGNTLSIFKSGSAQNKILHLKKITIGIENKPRQGVNTCGANDVFIFNEVQFISQTEALVESKILGKTTLPSKFLYPLLCNKNFYETNPVAYKYILLPYDHKTGKPLSEDEIKSHPSLNEYLHNTADILKKRKGILINSLMKRGYLWGLLGVGKYNFSLYKVAWLAYGYKDFKPRVFSTLKGKEWQCNQAMQAYIPCREISLAKKISDTLSSEKVQKYLDSFKMTGTKSWAQPGKIKDLFIFEED